VSLHGKKNRIRWCCDKILVHLKEFAPHWYIYLKKRKVDILWKQKIEEGNTIESEEALISTLLVSHEIDAWYIDFGTSMHLSSRKEWFHDYDNTILVKIYMGENSI
jgi:hypothetical protein